MKRLTITKSIMAAVMTAVVSVLSVGLFSAKISDTVIAQVDYDRIVQFDYVTQEDIDQKKKERDDAIAAANEAAETANNLHSESDDLNKELAELKGLSAAQSEQYEMISKQYAAALLEKAVALDEYIEAQENLNNARELFSKRVSVMFEYQNKSTFEVLLESDSIAGFFTNLEIISLIADSDSQVVDMMTIALDEAQLANDNALLEAEELQGIAEEKSAQLEELRSRIGVTEDALEDVNTQLTTLEQKEDELNEWALSLDDQIKQLQEELYRKPTPTPVEVVEIPKVEPADTTPTETTPVETEPTETIPPETEPTETTPAETTETTEYTEATESIPESTDETTESTEETEETVPEETDPSETEPEETDPSETEPSESEPLESQIEIDPTSTPTPTPEPTATPAPVVEEYVRPATNGSLSWPTWTTKVTSYYGNRVHPVYGVVKFHSGIDIGASMGDSIMASASGTVIYLETPCLGSNTGGSGYGNYLIIDHGNGVSTLYGHCRDIYVNNGDYVSAGQQIGEVGSTGTSTAAHLHYEVRVYGSTVDPLSYLP